MDMDTYFSLPEFQNHPEADFYRKQLGEGSPLTKGEIREGMLVFNEETACCWGGPYPCNTAHFILVDCREWSDKWCGRTLAAAQADARVRLEQWIATATHAEARVFYQGMLARVNAGDHATIHQLEERGTIEYPIRIWVLGNDDTSYSKWFATVEEAEELLTLMEDKGPLDFEQDFLPFTWTFTN